MSSAVFRPITNAGSVECLGRRDSGGEEFTAMQKYNRSTDETSEQNLGNKSCKSHQSRTRYDTDSSDRSDEGPSKCSENLLMRRSSSVMRVRHLRDVLSEITAKCSSPLNPEETENQVTSSQKAKLLVASQQRLVSRLQDLRHELDGMDNEVDRVKRDIMNSRRYFSAMTGLPCRLEWPLNRQMDSAYTSPTSFFSQSTNGSPYSSDSDSPKTAKLSRKFDGDDSPFQSLQNFEDLPQPHSGQLSRSDSCSSFMSWRSDVELAGVFPEEADPISIEAYNNLRAKKKHHACMK